jgi:hypothetical protein
VILQGLGSHGEAIAGMRKNDMNLSDSNKAEQNE